MPVTKCPVAECIYTTGDVGDAVGAVLLGHHLQSVHPSPAPAKPPVFDLPKVKSGLTEDEFGTYEQEWSVFKKSSNVGQANLTAYLLNTCDKELEVSVVKEDPGILSKPEKDILAAIKRLAVVNIATSVLQTELITLTQNPDEPIRHFAARAQGKAKNCKLSVVCGSDSCNHITSYSGHSHRHG